jgi:hypothetical protein
MKSLEDIILEITRDEDYPETFDSLDLFLREDGNNNSKKPESKALIELLNKIISSKGYQPKTKFYAIMVITSSFIHLIISSQLVIDHQRFYSQRIYNILVLSIKFLTTPSNALTCSHSRPPKENG